MNMFRAFMELDAINENINRQELIARFRKATGKNYNLNDTRKFPDRKLYSMVMDAEAKARREREKNKPEAVPNNKQELDAETEPISEFNTCDFCGTRLNYSNQCPKCDLGEEDY